MLARHFPDGRQTDTHCFSPIYGDFLQDRHVVEGGPTPYSGDTLYRYHVMARSIGFVYTPRTGRAAPAGRADRDGMTFPEETHRSPDGSEMTIRSAWTRDGADAYLVVSESAAGRSLARAAGGCGWCGSGRRRLDKPLRAQARMAPARR